MPSRTMPTASPSERQNNLFNKLPVDNIVDYNAPLVLTDDTCTHAFEYQGSGPHSGNYLGKS